MLIMEMVSGKLQVVAGTAERLFVKLADETAQGLQHLMRHIAMQQLTNALFQDMDYVDTYLLCHSYFCTAAELLENLMARYPF